MGTATTTAPEGDTGDGIGSDGEEGGMPPAPPVEPDVADESSAIASWALSVGVLAYAFF